MFHCSIILGSSAGVGASTVCMASSTLSSTAESKVSVYITLLRPPDVPSCIREREIVT